MRSLNQGSRVIVPGFGQHLLAVTLLDHLPLVQHQQDHVKHHEEKPHGHITEIAPDKSYGRIESADGRWLYFHRNSLIGAELDALAIGTPVHYVEEMGDDGPQASSVYPVGKHHILV